MAAPNISTLNTEPNANTTLGTINVAENCPAANVNDALRYLAACVAVARDTIPNTANYVTKSGGQFTDNPTYSGQGGFLHNASSSAPGGTVSFIATGGALPASAADGDIVIFFG